MKNIFLILITLFAINATAQVKFTLENAKDKTANIVYIGAANTFRVSTPQEISVTNITTSQGNIRMNTDGTFSLYVHEASDKPVEIKYTQTKNGAESAVTYPVKYTIKNAPEMLQLKVGDYTKSGKVSLAKLQKNHKVDFKNEGPNAETGDLVISFNLLHKTVKGGINEFKYFSNASEHVKYFNDKIKTLEIGDKLYFENVEITSESGISQKVENLNFEIVK